MRIFKLIALVLFLLPVTFTATAQKSKGEIKRIAKYKPPKLSTILVRYKDSTLVNAEELAQIITQPLRVVDDKKNVYTISSYQFLYRKNVLTEDEEGKTSPATSIYSKLFTSTPLPKSWTDKVTEQPLKGELIYFFDIIVKDNQGRVMYAPDIKITVM